ncbi:MAG: ABC transporter ATP-binding protein [Endomicrobiales bacterium]|nr:ABC transporter ATP-binding protein [Endomicrobiales bacterium]
MNREVSIKGVSVSYRENAALRNVSIDIAEGSFVSVIGPNGAGKTTFLTVINGLGNITAGTVEVFGERITRRNLNRIRKDIGYVPQHLAVDPRSPISVREAVNIGRFGKIGLGGRWKVSDDEIVENALRTVGIAGLADKPIGHLSGGEHQKVSIARALAQEPRIILLDEPTSNLDPRAQNEIIGLIENIYKDKKYTVVFVTHVLSHIPHSCTDVVLMKNAMVVNSGPADKMLEAGVLSELYDFPMHVSIVHGRKHFHAGHLHPGHPQAGDSTGGGRHD